MASAQSLNTEFLRSMGLDDEEIAIVMADNCPNCEPQGFDDSSPCCGALVFRGECQFCGADVAKLDE